MFKFLDTVLCATIIGLNRTRVRLLKIQNKLNQKKKTYP
jgi:hypothetical protein